jgi:glycyl-tRNA synthetase beta chain
VRDHYKPAGPSDSVPTAPVTVALALADKLDTLVGFFAIDDKPTGSRDPFALRRAALGGVNILLESEIGLSLADITDSALRILLQDKVKIQIRENDYLLNSRVTVKDMIIAESEVGISEAPSAREAEKFGQEHLTWVVEQERKPLLAFFADRLKVLLRDEGKRHDLVDAVFALGDDDLVRIVARVEALSVFLATEDGASLLAGYKRATNILKAEAKKGADEDLSLNPALSDAAAPEEAALVAAVRLVTGQVDEALQTEDFTRAMQKLAHLRAPVDAFFDKVLVNDPDPEVRLNRLRLLTQVRDTANRVADFSLISG